VPTELLCVFITQTAAASALEIAGFEGDLRQSKMAA
jgi:hypothetical protein